MAIKTLKKLSVPDQKDCIFTSPDFKSWQSLLSENKTSLARLERRNTLQGELLNIAAEYTRRMGLPVSHFKNTADIIVSGHQPNWHHCGIFAKNAITDRLARRTGGTAVQLVLDHDICNTSICLPETDNDGFLRLKTIPLERKYRDIPLECRPTPPKEQLRKFIDSVLKISKGSLCSDIWYQGLHHILGRAALCRSAADLITLLHMRLNHALGFETIYLPVSLMSRSEGFIEFLCSVFCNILSFVRTYNRAIETKRQTDNLRPNQTVRILKTDYLNNIIEFPFWLVSKTGKRASLYVSLDDKNLRIGTVDRMVGTIDSSIDKKQQLFEILRKKEHMVRPKAVTLTLFARLYLADLFVHGTGAVNYEYITDHLIKNYYRIPKLHFGIATATMTLSEDAGSWHPEISKEVLNHREFFFGLFARDKLERLADTKDCQDENRLNHFPTS